MEVPDMRTALLLTLAAVLTACSDTQPSLVSPVQEGLETSGAALHATMRFGLAPGSVGTDFLPPATHDRSIHAYDNVRPQAVVIAAGGSVTFEISFANHQVAIYEPGTRPDDIDVTQTEPIPAAPAARRITDADGLVVRGPDQQFTPLQWTTPAGTFDEPGEYLVICTTFNHFVIANMYGWVIVR
jgi:plastocyanin